MDALPPSECMRRRIESLDYLRGLLAVGVLAYHYSAWSTLRGPLLLESLLNKTGIYAVLSFYVISGISFGYVYIGLRARHWELVAFWSKRFFRLAPLYWFAMVGVLLQTLPAMLHGRSPDLPSSAQLVTNATLTFGIIHPRWYMVTGGWSIGNEMAYYIAFPLVILALRRSPWLYALILLSAVGIAGSFAFRWLDPSRPLADQWATYINPFSHLYLFVAGVGIAHFIGRFGPLPRRPAWTAVAGLFIVYLLLPLRGDNVAIVTGLPWVAYSSLCIAFCAVISLTPLALPIGFHRPLAWVGQASYSVYLLHPLAYAFATMALRYLGVASRLRIVVVAVLLTFAVSRVVYRRLEMPMIEVGRRYASRWSADLGRLAQDSAGAVAPLGE